MTEPFTVGQFGGLRLDLDALDVGATQATAISNVDLDIPGMIRTRPGRANVLSTDSATFASAPYRVVSVDDYNHALYLAKIVTDGATVAIYRPGAFPTDLFTTTATAAGPVDVAAYSGAGSNIYYIDSTGIRKFNGVAGTVAAVASSPKGGLLSMTNTDSRAVAAYCGLSAISTSRVHFSDPGLPEVWGVNNWVEVGKADEESITALETFGDYVMVFKETNMFVFPGNSVDVDGQPIFNYRTVSLGDRMPKLGGTYNPSGRVCSDETGVYFLGSRGVWATKGGPPQLLSGAISPIFRGEVAAIPNTFTFVASSAGRLYVGGPTSTNTLVYEKATDQWSVYGIQASAIASSSMLVTAGSASTLRAAWIVDGSSKRLTQLDPQYTTDLGSTISCSWTSGRYPLADPGRVAVTLESSVVGSGTVSLRNTTDTYGADASATSMTLGVAPATAEGWHQVDNEGTVWSHTLSWSGSASVNRLSHFVSFVKPPGVR